ncbi:MAG TPA: hypothetical protein DCM86_19425 [Verrucomicrobiales bacterium]|nr:hypothetical protein [Verrucomicrobiales bacterium]
MPTRYHLLRPGEQPSGPWTLEELRAARRNGTLDPSLQVESEDGASRQTVATLLGERPGGLARELLIPWAELTSGGWLRHRRAFLIAGVGLLPLMAIASLGEREKLTEAYWAIAFYFSLLWAAFFYHAYPVRDVSLGDAAFCFFGSALCCTLILWGIYHFTGAQFLLPWVASTTPLKAWIGQIGGVGLPEELCKLSILALLFRRKDRLPPHAMLFYGLMAGLGFGIYEGVRYQVLRNAEVAPNAASYYLLNVLRLTSLPFLHAVWTGIAGYFLGLALLHPERRYLLWTLGVGMAALLHGTYNFFSGSALGLVIALGSVLVQNMYLSRTLELERVLRGRRGGTAANGV